MKKTLTKKTVRRIALAIVVLYVSILWLATAAVGDATLTKTVFGLSVVLLISIVTTLRIRK